ncbi:hypothetical protein [Bacterioplanoides sp. SCSIO 12839]|uniref:hypothetical protein n=1 Tax=Bacterioplanoides sp. SCSIO 12839 TaxID=2829569 RepID=UPI002106DDAE|nr:hypothetical protein [Bacterioplanoides sp. SCSIO 12839]UTW47569.1 hypothetical protein KFF03_13430 [Bacterioplanoides sp. SCSIO 12839]
MSRCKLSLSAAVLMTASQLAHASDLNINGFMSVGAGVLSNSDVVAEGYDDDISFNQDTMVALQVSKQINESTSATTQFVARGREDYNTENTWAYITYSFNENTDLRMGRLRSPFFYYSDFLEVGYAYNWIRPPEEVYGRLDVFSSINGFDLTHNFNLGATDGSVQVYYGRTEEEFAPVSKSFSLDAKNFTGMVLNLNRGNWGTRLSYHQADATIPEINDITEASNSELAALAVSPTADPAEALVAAATLQGFGDDFKLEDATGKFYEAAVTYDSGSYFMIAEWTALDYESELFVDDSAYLISAAKRFNDSVIHLTYTAREDKKGSGAIGAIQNNFLRDKESSIILGARFDYDTSTAFKLEAQYIDEELRDGQESESAVLYSVAIDLVF